MAIDDGATGEQPEWTGRARSRLFAVRLWTEEVTDGREHRGSVRDVTSGAFRSFRDWSDLIAFLTARMDDDDRAHLDRTEGDAEWLSRSEG
jgi:hypothetical protein